MKFVWFGIVVLAVAGFCACGRAQSPADSITLGHAKNCNDAGVWDGLECATPHVQDANETPIEKSKAVARKKPNAVPPPLGDDDCDCEAGEPGCECPELQ
ncbi:MAG: hypothetical protein ABI461_02855 [Polyangiaceae bacterium]